MHCQEGGGFSKGRQEFFIHVALSVFLEKGCLQNKATVIASERSPEGASGEAIRKTSFTRQN
jgi:hypothetical protein